MLITSSGGSVGGCFSVTTNPTLLPFTHGHLHPPQSDRFPGNEEKKSWSEVGVLWWCAAPTAAISHFLPHHSCSPHVGAPTPCCTWDRAQRPGLPSGLLLPPTRHHSQACKLLCICLTEKKNLTEGDTKHAPRSRPARVPPPGHTRPIPLTAPTHTCPARCLHQVAGDFTIQPHWTGVTG